MNTILFPVSKKEIKRRIGAFGALLTSFTICSFGLMIWWYPKIIFNNRLLFGLLLVGATIINLGLKKILSDFFRKLMSGTIEVTKTRVDEIKFEDVIKVSITTTTNNTPRAIGLITKQGKVRYFDGLDNFEEFKLLILDRCRGAKVSIAKELGDYDSPLFYPILGLGLSVFFLVFLGFLTEMDSQGIKFVQLVVMIGSLALGGYFLTAKPLENRYGIKSRINDLVFGLVFIIAGGAIGLLISK